MSSTPAKTVPPGLAISESEYSHQALSDIIPFREAFMSLFFISVGMLLDPAIHRFGLVLATLVAAVAIAVLNWVATLLNLPSIIKF